MKKTLSMILLLLFSLSGPVQAQAPASPPIVSLDTEHGVAMRLIQELVALKALADEGASTQAAGNDLVLIDFDELAEVFDLIRDELQHSLKRKYGHADVSTRQGLF